MNAPAPCMTNQRETTTGNAAGVHPREELTTCTASPVNLGQPPARTARRFPANATIPDEPSGKTDCRGRRRSP